MSKLMKVNQLLVGAHVTWVWGCVDFGRRIRGRTPLSSRGDCGVGRSVVCGEGELSVYLEFCYEILGDCTSYCCGSKML